MPERLLPAGVFDREREARASQQLSYKAFKGIAVSEVMRGAYVLTGVSPSKLWASQDWVDPVKVSRVQHEHVGAEELELPAYFKDLPTGQRAIILANGHHHALQAWEEASKVNVKILGQLPEGVNIISFSRYRRENGDVFRNL